MVSWADPIPPGHGEPENVGASPGAACYSPMNPLRPKRVFRSAAAARKFNRRDSGLHRHGRYPYHCSNCGGWHLSSHKGDKAL
jgi:hypothetical protein